MAKKKRTPPAKTAARPAKPAKNPPEKKPSPKKKPAQKRRPRSRGKARNKKSEGLNAATAVEKASGITIEGSDVVRHNDPPEEFKTGPTVSLLDGTESSISREAAIIEEILRHESWQIPPNAFIHIPHKLTQISMNAKPDPKNPNVMKAGTGDWSTNPQLTAMRILERLHHNNLQKLVAVKPAELRVLHEQSTVVTTEDQRFAVLAAIASELDRRQSRRKIPDQQDSNSVEPFGSRRKKQRGTKTSDES